MTVDINTKLHEVYIFLENAQFQELFSILFAHIRTPTELSLNSYFHATLYTGNISYLFTESLPDTDILKTGEPIY